MKKALFFSLMIALLATLSFQNMEAKETLGKVKNQIAQVMDVDVGLSFTVETATAVSTFQVSVYHSEVALNGNSPPTETNKDKNYFDSESATGSTIAARHGVQYFGTSTPCTGECDTITEQNQSHAARRYGGNYSPLEGVGTRSGLCCLKH